MPTILTIALGYMLCIPISKPFFYISYLFLVLSVGRTA